VINFIAVFGLAAWVYLVFLHRNFWRADQRLPKTAPPLPVWPPVTAVVPARNEAGTIGAVTAALLAQDYPGPFRVIVVDDASTDGTAGLARAASAQNREVGARNSQVGPPDVLTAPPLEAGWTGKLWALNAGLRHLAAQNPPEYLWFTDADVIHPPETLTRLVSKAVMDRRDLVSLMVKLRCQSFWERRLIPAFVFFFQMLYPFPAANDDRSRIAAAAGGCVLLRREAFEKAGGLAAVRGKVIDDCAIAALIKRAGGGIWVGLADASHSLRRADSLEPLWGMVRRTAFTQLYHSNLLLFLTILGLVLVFLGPPIATLFGHGLAFWAGLAAWGIMAFTYVPTLRDYGRSPWEGLLLPAVATLYAAMTFDSAVAHWRQRGGQWKGRHYGPSSGPGNLPESP